MTKVRANRKGYFIRCGTFRMTPDEALELELEGELSEGAIVLFNHLQRFAAQGHHPLTFNKIHRLLNAKRPKDKSQKSETTLSKRLKELIEHGMVIKTRQNGETQYWIHYNSHATPTPKNGVATPENGATAPKNGVATPENGATAPKNGVVQPQKRSGDLRDSGYLRDAPEPRETAQPVIPTAAPAQPESSFIHTEKKEARSAPTSSVDVRTGDWREAGEHLRAFIAKMNQYVSNGDSKLSPTERSGDATETAEPGLSDFAKQLEDPRRELINAGISPATADHLLQRHHPARILCSLRSPDSPLAIMEVREHLRAAQARDALQLMQEAPA